MRTDVYTTFARGYLERLKQIIDDLPMQPLEQLMRQVEQVYLAGKCLFIVGNGGSASTASHLMTDLGKGILGRNLQEPKRRLRVMSLTDNISLITAWANDTDYTRVFSEQLRNHAVPGDLLIAVSASGNSPNIVEAAKSAREMGLTVAAITGFDGGKLALLADIKLVVPSTEYGPIEDLHLMVGHILTGYLTGVVHSSDLPVGSTITDHVAQ